MDNKTQQLSLMIIEDDADLLETYKDAIPTNWSGVFFSDARSALLHYSSKPQYDLILTDLEMSPKNGESLIFDIKYLNPFQKIIVLSGDASGLNLPQKFNVQIFQKPWNIQNITRVFSNWDQDTQKEKNQPQVCDHKTIQLFTNSTERCPLCWARYSSSGIK